MEQQFSDLQKRSDINHQQIPQYSPLKQNKQASKDSQVQNLEIGIAESFADMLKNNLKDSDQNCFTLENPSTKLIIAIINHWMNRQIKTNRCILKLSIQNHAIDKKTIALAFQSYPSIIVTFNGQKIQNNQIFQTTNEIFYEGTPKMLSYYDSNQKIEYHGEVQVDTRRPHGKGYLKCTKQTDLFIYAGQFNDGYFQGLGHLQDKINMVSYVGQFHDDCKHGEGDETIIVKTKKGKMKKWHYSGKFVNGMREGQGKQTSNKGLYDGQWKDGVKNGRGIYRFQNGNIYDGEWKNNRFQGKGVLTEKGKGSYKGDFKNGLFEGKGVYSYDSKDRYDGQFMNNLRNGKGIYTWSDGDYYQGEWKDDKAHGNGSILSGLSYYQGQFKQGYKHGDGELTNQDGDVIKGKWQNNKLILKYSD